MSKEKCVFKFKENVWKFQIAHNKRNYKISNSNLTNELAAEFLKKNPDKRIELFSEYPENWKQAIYDLSLLGGSAPEQECEDCDGICKPCIPEELKSMKFNELKAEYKDKVKYQFGMTKAEYLQEITEQLYSDK